nr:Glycosyltransferase (RfaG) [uncultured Mediterranean phage uvMED]
MKNEYVVVYEAPIHSLSGYGYNSREVANYLIDIFANNLLIVETHWGNNQSYSDASNSIYSKYINKQVSEGIPIELFIQVSLPTEFKKVGNRNVGITALVESTLCSKEFVNGCNTMDLVILPSEFSKQVLKNSAKKHNIKLTCKIEVINQTTITNETDNALNLDLVDNDFCFLFNGKWDTETSQKNERKNVESLLRSFISAFYGKDEKPALVLKVHNKNYSILDYERIKNKIKSLLETIDDHEKSPSIYIIHGDLSDTEINKLYAHKKIKCYVSCSRGEGFGRPVLEASLQKCPIIVSNYGGHLDIVTEEKNLISGTNKQITNINIGMNSESDWFECSDVVIRKKLIDVYNNYTAYTELAEELYTTNINKFDKDIILNQYKEVLSSYIYTL